MLVGKKGHWEKYVVIGQSCAEFLRLSIREISFLSFASVCLPCLLLSVIHIERLEIRGSSSWCSPGDASAFNSLPSSSSVLANTWYQLRCFLLLFENRELLFHLLGALRILRIVLHHLTSITEPVACVTLHFNFTMTVFIDSYSQSSPLSPVSVTCYTVCSDRMT